MYSSLKGNILSNQISTEFKSIQWILNQGYKNLSIFLPEMPFSKPVVAALSLVLGAGLAILVLFLSGISFSSSNTGEEPDETDQKVETKPLVITESILKKELSKAVDACTDDFDEKGVIANAIKSFSSELPAVQDEIALCAVKDLISGKSEEGRATSLRIYKVVLLFDELYKMKEIQCNGQEECKNSLKGKVGDLAELLWGLGILIEVAHSLPDFDSDEMSPQYFVMNVDDNKHKRQMVKLKIMQEKRRYEFRTSKLLPKYDEIIDAL